MKGKEKYITLSSEALGISKERFIDSAPLKGEIFMEFIESLHWKFFVSNMGRILKINTGKFSGTKNRPRKYKIYSALYNINKEYPSILIFTPIRYAKSIHRLVAISFISNPDSKRCVNHKNGNKHDNRVENLEWVTHSENNQHARDTGLNIAPKGIKSTNSKQVAKLDSNNNIIEVFGSLNEAARTYKTAQMNIWDVVNNRRKYTLGHKWKYITKEEYLYCKDIFETAST